MENLNIKMWLVGHVFAFASSVTAGYFTVYIKIHEIFSLPPYVYTGLLIFVGILIFFQMFFSFRFLKIKSQDSKQYANNFYETEQRYGKVVAQEWTFRGFEWRTLINLRHKKLNQIAGPYCSKGECGAELECRKTFWGKYYFECPACDFEEVKEESKETLQSAFAKTVTSRGQQGIKVKSERVVREK